MSQKHAPYYAWISDTYAEDKYTWVVELGEPFAEWFYWLSGAWFQVAPRETIEAGPRDWKNMVGTGPFLMTEYVKGSQAVFDRIPDYWDTTTIDGKEYQTPFIDRLVWPIIVDTSTQIAALRTGKIDWVPQVPLNYEETLDTTSPELVKYPYLENRWLAVALQCKTSEYFDDVDVRRALHIGTDIQTILDAVIINGEMLTALGPVGESWKPSIDELPASAKMLFEYDPELAKQMIADAGYPDGFDMQMTYCPEMTDQSDIASMLVAMWAKIGVNVTLDPVEMAVFNNYVYGHGYTDALLGGCGPDGTPTTSLVAGVSGSSSNSSDWEDQWFTDSYDEAFRMGKDVDEANALKREMIIYHTEASPYISLPARYQNCYAWPWVKNYYGEIETSFFHYIPMIKTLWIDQDLKAEMGY